MHRLFLE